MSYQVGHTAGQGELEDESLTNSEVSKRLAGLSDPAARMGRLLGVHTGPDITAAAAASLTGLPPHEARLALLELREEHLVTDHAPGRYTCHNLLRCHAAELAHSEDGGLERRSALHRLLDHYLHTASGAAGLLYPRCLRFTAGSPQPGVQPEEIGHSREAEQWFTSERHVLLDAIDRAVGESYRPHAWALPWVVGSFFRDEACLRRFLVVQTSALRVAAEHGDLAGRALASLHLGRLRFWLRQTAEACRDLEDAIELYRAQGDKKGTNFALDTLGRHLAELGMTP